MASIRALSRVMVVFYGIGLVVLACLLHPASPGPWGQDIYGIRVGSLDAIEGSVYVSGRRLACAPATPPTRFRTTCSIMIAGKLLQIDINTNDSDYREGSCAASYNTALWPCLIGPGHADIHAIAFIDRSLGLNAQQLDHLRDQYPIENLPEAPFVIGLLASSLLVMLIAALFVWSTYRQTGRLIIGILIPVAACVAYFANAFLWILISGGFWD